MLVAGKMGKAFAYRADNGQHLWTVSVGKHKNDTGRLPRKPIDITPGELGGVETPMAYAAGRLFVPWLDLATRASASGTCRRRVQVPPGPRRPDRHRRRHRQGGLAAEAAVDGLRRGHGRERRRLHQHVRRRDLRVRHGNRQDALDDDSPAGINSFPAIDGDTLLVGAAAPGFFKKPQFQLIAYSLGT